ncbi:hypothetical protein F5I97DRAFT_936252 [Phlebopus sp. FC_14]|nr:hypothetical protein F5I97DRAFT_936252 [Phlebopus sp. FC_14]
MSPALLSMALRQSALRDARLALHKSRGINVASLRAMSFSSDLIADMGLDQPRPVAPETPRSLPVSQNPLSVSRVSASKDFRPPEPPRYLFHGRFTKNNTQVSVARPDGKLIENGWWSGGSIGARNANRKTHEAAYQCAVHAFRRIEELVQEVGPIRLAVRFAGFSRGRSAIEQVFMTSEGDKIRPWVVEIEDRTPIKIGGTRSKKPRRL